MFLIKYKIYGAYPSLSSLVNVILNVWVQLAVAYAIKGESEKAAAAVAEVLKLNPKWNLSNFGNLKPMSASPPAYKEWYETKFLPAGRKAGLPE
jgi:hypothetical protein